MFDVVKSTWRHLWMGVRGMAFLRIDPAQLRTIGPEPVLIVLASLVAEVLLDFWKVDSVMFSAWGVSANVTSVAVLVAAMLLMQPRLRGIDLGSMVSVIGAMSIVLIPLLAAGRLVSGVIFEDSAYADASEGLLGLALLPWFLGAVWLFGRRSTQVRPRRFGLGLVTALLVSMFVLPSTPLLHDAREASPGLLQSAFYYLRSKPVRVSNRPQYVPIDVEATFARQVQLIDAQLDGLAPSRPGKGEVYFVGMAPYAMQDVFKREITSARDIMDERFGTRGHSVLLVNHRDTIETHPLATAINLERVLWRIAQRMDLEHDALVLFITTHGSEGMMSVSFPSFSLNDLTPEKLSGILARTGIRNKVVVLSACHAGSFLPALARPDTLVMAAARADRASFGCSNERDWTYFGDALFNHALRDTHSFTGAFDRAKSLVGDWETAQKLAPASEPQTSGGEGITAKLEGIARRLDLMAAR
jgi:hypothetical protein